MEFELPTNPDEKFEHSCEGSWRSTASVVSTSSTTCHLCGYESDRVSNLKRHMKKMHESSRVVELQCCEIRFEDKAKYREHCRTSHKNGHECSTCHRLFSRRALLRRHQSVHTGLKDFHCDLCFYASSHKSNLERHLKTHQNRGRLRKGPRSSTSTTSQHQVQVQVQPDSTTTNVPTFPILRDMLRPKSHRKVKATLSHSIESILRRKESKAKLNSTVTSSSLLREESAEPLADLTRKSEFPLVSEVNWGLIDGSASLISNPSSWFTQDLRNLWLRDNNSVLSSWIPTCLPIRPPILGQESRLHTHYLTPNNLFSPYYTSHVEPYPAQEHPPLRFNNENNNCLPVFTYYPPQQP